MAGSGRQRCEAALGCILTGRRVRTAALSGGPMNKLVLVLTAVIAGSALNAGCEDDPNDKDFLKDSGTPDSGSGGSGMSSGTGGMGTGGMGTGGMSSGTGGMGTGTGGMAAENDAGDNDAG